MVASEFCSSNTTAMKRLAVAMFVVLAFACSCNRSEPEPTLTTAETLTLHPNGWVLKSILSWRENRWVDAIAELGGPGCALDDAYVFYADGRYEVLALNSCNNEPNETGQWHLGTDGLLVNFVPDPPLPSSASFSWALKSVSSKELSLRSSQHIGSDHSIYIPR